MKHYFRLIILLVLILLTVIVFPFGLLSEALGRGKPFGDYLIWLVELSEKWYKEALEM